ncbi:MAG: cyclic-di-AMP receptor, partial [Clostridiales bacterium]|nr:cyclic-di-AMP receptor [Clostridiales bacterium]
IVNGSDEKAVVNEMMKGGYYVTKLAGTGGFLRARTATLISAVNNERVESALEIIRRVSKGRKYDLTKMNLSSRQMAQEFFDKSEIVVGGATVFVLNIENFYKY